MFLPLYRKYMRKTQKYLIRFPVRTMPEPPHRHAETPPQRKLNLLGTGTIIPHAERGQSALLLECGGGLNLLFDCGSGTETRLAQAGVDPCSIGHIFLTHHHIDHDAGLMPLLKGNWLASTIPSSSR